MFCLQDLKLVLRPVWDWSEQFADKDKVFFTNPFYQKRQEVLSRKSIAIPPNAIRLPGLQKPGSRMTFDPSLFSTQSTVPKVIQFSLTLLLLANVKTLFRIGFSNLDTT